MNITRPPRVQQNGAMSTMLRTLLVLFAVASSVAFAEEVKPTPLPKGHPLLGTWRLELADGCFEQYTLRADGTKSSMSGQQINESVFEISGQPSARGFYRWVDKIIMGNGKPDCAGSTTPANATNFILLHPSGTRFLLCEQELVSSCFAEFRLVGRNN